jgi:hypothetical protein
MLSNSGAPERSVNRAPCVFGRRHEIIRVFGYTGANATRDRGVFTCFIISARLTSQVNL